MSRATELLAQYQAKIAQVGQWIAIRRFAGTTVKTYTDTPARAYLRYAGAKEFVGAVTHGELMAIALVDTLTGILPISTNDKLVTSFYGFADPSAPPSLDGESHVTGGKQSAITSAIKRDPEGILIALEIHAVG